MAKTIKFNLICDGNPIRTIEDLRENFSIEDVLSYYDSRLLHRWLTVRGYYDELEKVNKIEFQNKMDVIKELIAVFKVPCDDEDVEKSIYMLEYSEKRKDLYKQYADENYSVNKILDEYQKGYDGIVDEILANPNDAAKIKAGIAEIAENYAWVLKLNHRDLFKKLISQSAYLAIMCLLMNEVSRIYYLPNYTVNDEDNDVLDIDLECYADKKVMFDEICALVKTADFKKTLGGSLLGFAGVTDGYWKDLEPKGRKYMIISMGKGDFVRSAGVTGGDLSSTDVNTKFVMLDGIDYKSNSDERRLLYMEV